MSCGRGGDALGVEVEVEVGVKRTAFLRMRSGEGVRFSVSVQIRAAVGAGEREGVRLGVWGGVGLWALSSGAWELGSEYEEVGDEVSETDALESASSSSSSSVSVVVVAGRVVGRGSDAAAASYASRARCSVRSLAAERLYAERARASWLRAV